MLAGRAVATPMSSYEIRLIPKDPFFVPDSKARESAGRVLSQLVAASGSSFDRSALTRSEATALKELVELGAVKKLSRDHFIALEKPAEFEARIKDVMAEPPYSDYWSLLLEGVPWPEALRRAFSFHQLASGTLLALGKRTANWGRSLGHLPKKRLSFARDQTQTSMAFISKDTD